MIKLNLENGRIKIKNYKKVFASEENLIKFASQNRQDIREKT